MESIYDYIRENSKNGYISRSYVELNGVQTGGKIDGIIGYRYAWPPFHEKQYKRFDEAIALANDGCLEAFDLLTTFEEEGYCPFMVTGYFMDYIRHHPMNTKQIRTIALDRVYHSLDIDEVKYALLFLNLFPDDEEVKKAVRLFALDSEFTYFALYAMIEWDHHNEEIFKIAKKVNGWGLYQALSFLQADTPAIKKWILYKADFDQYSIHYVFEKSGVEEILTNHQHVSEEVFHRITLFIDEFMDPSTISNIERYVDSEKMISAFLEEATLHHLVYEDFQTISLIKSHYERHYPEIAQICDTFLHSTRCTLLVKKQLAKGCGFRFAKKIGVPYRQEMVDFIENNFIRHITTCISLLKFEPEVITDLMPFVYHLYECDHDLYHLLIFKGALGHFPGLGEDLVQLALRSDDADLRGAADEIIYDWQRIEAARN